MSTSSVEARPPAAFDGRSAHLRAGGDAGYWVWTDKSGVHLRWTTAGEQRRFAGTLSAEDAPLPSPIVAISDAGQASAPTIERAEDGSITFQGQCQGCVSGLDLPPITVRLTLALSLDGLPAPLHALRLGESEIHPRRNPFRLRPPEPAHGGLDHHAHPHVTPHAPGEHHPHPHPHPHPAGLGHHHQR